jgi:hypothetical protein
MRPIDIPQLPYLTSLPSAQTLPSFVPLMNFISLPWPLSRLSAARTVSPTVTPSTTLTKPSSIASLLRYYETPGIPPPSSRVDPLLQQKGGHVMGIRDLLSLGGLIALKGESTSGSPQQYFFLSVDVIIVCPRVVPRLVLEARDTGQMSCGRFCRRLLFSSELTPPPDSSLID